VKKCASCTKDLPDAALHCVFCGAKQAPAPATAGGAAKTVMGHASSEMIEQLKAQAAAAASRQAPSNLPSAAPYSAPRPSGPQGGYPPPSAPQYAAPAAPPAMVPTAGAVAPTMFVPGGGGPPGGGYPAAPAPAPGGFGPPAGYPPAPAPVGPAPSHAQPSMPLAMPAPIQPVAPIPSAVPPYLASRTAARAGRPLEPWKDSLRLMMFIWGGVLLLYFVTPVSIEPLKFQWDLIIDGEGASKLEPLIIVATGLLSLLLAWIPMSPSPRGLIGGLLGLTGLVVPLLLALSKSNFDLSQLIFLVGLVGTITVIPGLLLRNEYRDSIMPRILVTVGVLAMLAQYIVPQHDHLLIVELFKAIIDGPGKLKIAAGIELAQIVLIVMALLVWLPSPASGGAKVFAWLLILWPAVHMLTRLLVDGDIGAAVKASPSHALMMWAPVSSFLVLIGYGFASVLGKQLE
jgi:hypothetical protein